MGSRYSERGLAITNPTTLSTTPATGTWKAGMGIYGKAMFGACSRSVVARGKSDWEKTGSCARQSG